MWHNLGGGHWWRPHTNGRQSWSALHGFQLWELRLVDSPAPPFLSELWGTHVMSLGEAKARAWMHERGGGAEA